MFFPIKPRKVLIFRGLLSVVLFIHYKYNFYKSYFETFCTTLVFANLSCKVTDKNLFENRRYKHIKLNISIKIMISNNGSVVTDNNKLSGISKKKAKKTWLCGPGK